MDVQATAAQHGDFVNCRTHFLIAHLAEPLQGVQAEEHRVHLDTETPPSQSPDRKEVVVLMLEDHSRNATVILPILRDADGMFTEFGDPGPMQFGESVGRFSGLMPHNKPSVREAAQARATLLGLGMNIVNRDFDPTMN